MNRASKAALVGLLLTAGLAPPLAGLDPPADEGTVAITVPDVSVVDQDGRRIRFYSDLVRGKVVAVNFVFTSCTTICGPQGATFAQVQKTLGARSGRDVHLISITLDPAVDTPERLKTWSDKLGRAPGWTLVTGGKDELVKLQKAFGAYTPDRIRHTPLLLVGNDRTARWTRAFSLAPAAQITGLIEGMLEPAQGTRGGK